MSGLWSEGTYYYNLMNVVCLGNESNVLECSHQQTFTYSCSSTSRISVICQQGIKIMYKTTFHIHMQLPLNHAVFQVLHVS